MPEKEVIYYDENAKDKEAEDRRYSESKLRRAEEEEAKMLEDAWERSVRRAEKRKKFIEAIKKIFGKTKTQTDQKER